MKLFQKITLPTLLFSSLTAHAYIPDLFGAYQKGATYAQEQNARDAYYYAEMNKPKFFFEVHDGRKQKAKNNFNLSPKNGDVVCWGIYNLENGNIAQAREIISMPSQNEFMGQSRDTQIQKTVHIARLNTNVLKVDKDLLSQNNQIYTCWIFHPTATPKGKYTISIEVGKRNFGTRAFNIID